MVGGILLGADTSAYAVEVEALLQATRALERYVDEQGGFLDVKVTILVENWAVVTRRNWAMTDGKLPTKMPAAWGDVRLCFTKIREMKIVWIPSHGKYEGAWEPPEGISEEETRSLNQAAGEEASSYAASAAAEAALSRRDLGKAETRAKPIILELEEKAIKMVSDHSRWLDREIKGISASKEWYHTSRGRRWLGNARRRIA